MESKPEANSLCFACKHKYLDDNEEPCKTCKTNGYAEFEEKAKKD